jgi:uncharacterized protein (TIGR03437 family)
MGTTYLRLGLTLIVSCIFGSGAFAQSGVRIDPGHPLAQYTIDGVTYVGPAVLFWPDSSKHILSIRSQDLPTQKVHLEYQCWKTNLQGDCLPTTVAITASLELTTVTGIMTMSYALTISFFKRDPSMPNAPSPGQVCFGASPCYDEDNEFYLPAGTSVAVTALPNPGYIFTGWGQLPGALANPKAFQITFPLNQPQVLRPLFTLARTVQVTVSTEPLGLKLLADRSPILSGTAFDWGINTVHTLGAIPVQTDSYGQVWIFDSWSDGGAVNHDVTVPGGASEVLTFTARFVRGAVYTFLTSPPSLKLQVDGRDNWPNYTFRWAAGTQHTVSAPLEQVDGQGRKYRFLQWSDGLSSTRDVVVDTAPADVRLTAEYQPVAQVTVTSSPAGIHAALDGQDCVTPCTVERKAGDSMRVAIPAQYGVDSDTKLVFQRWADGGNIERTVIFTPEPTTLTASYQTQYRLHVSLDPADAATLRVDPASNDSFYDAGANVAVTLDPYPGYQLARWEGDVSGTRLSNVLSLTAPKTIRALFDTVPYIFPGGVRNAAGDTPRAAVAPGSLISILGHDLASASDTASGAIVLPQILAGVTVRSGPQRDRFLPLLSVSPEEVKAQIPADIGLGEQTLVLSQRGKPDAVASFQVDSNAPGLFYTTSNGQPVGFFLHENGDPVTLDNPAVRTELLTLLGTGVGPYQQPPPDGFAMSGVSLIDSVVMISGDTAWQAIQAGGAEGLVGVNTITFRLPATLSVTDSLVPLRIQVNDIESNTVFLPLTQGE